MTNSERIEAYFNNELPEADRQQLLNDLETDPSLKAEFQFQEDVIEGIKAYRKKELIARLDQVQIASTGSSLLVKTISVVGVATIAVVGTYLWVNKTTDNESLRNQSSTTEEMDAGQTEQPVPEQITVADTEPAAEEQPAAEPVVENEPAQPEATKPAPATEAVSTSDAGTPQVVVPQVVEPSDMNMNVITEEDLVAPAAMTSSEIRLSTSTNVEVKFSKKYNFHYQIKEGRLTLYGDFGDTPFEVIELKTNKGINTYLYFENNFYCLKNDSEKIRPLVAIEDQDLIKELQKRR